MSGDDLYYIRSNAGRQTRLRCLIAQSLYRYKRSAIIMTVLSSAYIIMTVVSKPYERVILTRPLPRISS